MNKTYKHFLIHLFDRKKALLGEQIVDSLINEYSIKRDYARRIIKDAVSDSVLYSSNPLRFSHGQYGYSTINNKSVFHQLLDSKGGLKEIYKILSLTYLPENEMIKYAQSIYTSFKPEEALNKLVLDLKAVGPIREGVYKDCRFYYLAGNGRNTLDEFACERIIQNLKKDSKICQLIYSYCLNLNLISSGKYRELEKPYALIGEEVAFDSICYSTLSKNRSNKKITFLFEILIAYESGQAIKRFMKRSKAFYHRQKNGNNNYNARIINVIVLRDNNQKIRNKFDPYGNYMWIGLRQLFGKNIDSFLWLISQDTKLLGQIAPDESFYSKLNQLAESDFSHLFSQFLDDYFEIVINCCFSRITGKSFLGKTVYDIDSGLEKEFDGYYEDDNSIWIIESKNLGKSMVKWESYDSKGKIENDCLSYFFIDKVAFLRNMYPDKTIYACYVSKSGFSHREESEQKIISVERIPGFKNFLLTPQDIIDTAKKHKSDKEFQWLNKLYINNND